MEPRAEADADAERPQKYRLRDPWPEGRKGGVRYENPATTAEIFRDQYAAIGSEALPETTYDLTERARLEADMDRIASLAA